MIDLSVRASWLPPTQPVNPGGLVPQKVEARKRERNSFAYWFADVCAGVKQRLPD